MDRHLNMTLEETEKFSSHYDQTGPRGDPSDWRSWPCWTWDRQPPHKHEPNERGGYGKFKGQAAHRVMWVMNHGPIPDDPKKVGNSRNPKLEVCHRCDVRNCVQPRHLFLADHKGNHRDAARKGRKVSPSGIRTKLTAEIVMAMRWAVRAGATRESQARKYNVVVSTAMKAIAGTGPNGTWKHVPGALGWTDGPYQEADQSFFPFAEDAAAGKELKGAIECQQS